MLNVHVLGDRVIRRDPWGEQCDEDDRDGHDQTDCRGLIIFECPDKNCSLADGQHNDSKLDFEI